MYPIQAIELLNSEYPINEMIKDIAAPAITAKRNLKVKSKTYTIACGNQ